MPYTLAAVDTILMSTGIRTPTWVSRRRLFEQKLAELQNCPNLGELRQIHAQIFKANLHQDPFVTPKLVTAFSRCRQMVLAMNVFSQIQEPNIVIYNTLIRAFTQNSQPSLAFSIFFDMQKNGVNPDNFTYPFLLKACSGRFGLRQVQMIHSHIEKFGLYADIFVPNSLIDSYSRCGASGVAAARILFAAMEDRDVVSWNSMIAALARSGDMSEARRLFNEMPHKDTVSWNTVIDGYVKAGEMNTAFELFENMPERNVVSWSTMISGYSKVGDMDMARLLFDKMPVKNLVAWTVIISGYAAKGLAKEAFRLYNEMDRAGFKPDDGTLISILAACAESGLYSLGKKVHDSIERSKLICSTQVCNALIDMYAKCGNLQKAFRVFEGMVERDVVSWNAIIQGMAMHGLSGRALQIFSRMKQEGFVPDGVTFIGVLCACTHGGFVEEGRRYFSTMEEDFGIIPQIEHYGCMIDLLGRGGHLEEAFEFIKNMPVEPNAIIWGTLLVACRMHNHVGLAEEVVEHLVEFAPSDAGNYAVLSNIYAAAGHWGDVAKVRLQMKNIGSRKPPGASYIELDDEVHEFTVQDRSHPEAKRIYNMIDRLGQHLKQVGYVPKQHSEVVTSDMRTPLQ